MPRFRVGFGLRCFQPLSLGAWLLGDALSDNRWTSGAETQFLSYYGSLPFRHEQFLEIATNLSHDGLNPAHDPL